MFILNVQYVIENNTKTQCFCYSSQSAPDAPEADEAEVLPGKLVPGELGLEPLAVPQRAVRPRDLPRLREEVRPTPSLRGEGRE